MEDHLQNQNPVPHLLLHEQEIATQRIIQAQSQREAVSGPPNKDGIDLFSERPDPNALKEHLLKMASEHRAEMASKLGKPSPPEQGNLEIGNGYGVPGGGAYSYGTAGSDIATPGNIGLLNNNISLKISELYGESKAMAASKDLPEYLKQKLRARGILKDDAVKDDLSRTDNNLETGSSQLVEIGNFPPGWVEAKDPSTGASYYYNESIGKSKWERPVETSLSAHIPFATRFGGDWVEAVDETTEFSICHRASVCLLLWISSSTIASLLIPRTIMSIMLRSRDPTGNLFWERETEKIKGSMSTTMMMSWIPWIQALILMLPVVAGLLG